MSDKDQAVTESGVPRMAPKPARRPFFDGHERSILGFELFLLIAAIVGAGVFGIVSVFVKSIKW